MRRTEGHSTAGRIMSVNISSDVIGNPSRDLPAFNAVPQPTALPSEVGGHLINGHVQSCTNINL